MFGSNISSLLNSYECMFCDIYHRHFLEGIEEINRQFSGSVVFFLPQLVLAHANYSVVMSLWDMQQNWNNTKKISVASVHGLYAQIKK